MKVGDPVAYEGELWIITEKISGGYWIERRSKGRSFNRVWVTEEMLVQDKEIYSREITEAINRSARESEILRSAIEEADKRQRR